MKISLESENPFVWQWDTRKRVVLEGYPEGTPVHFSNHNSREALVVLSRMDGDKLVADIPPELMQEPNDIAVYICDEYNTQHIFFVSVISRTKPESYVYEPVEVLRYESLAVKIPFDGGYNGKLLYVIDGVARPLIPGEGVEIVRQVDGSYALVACGGGAVAEHNASETAHPDIRRMLANLLPREELPITDMAGYKIAPTGTVLTGDAATQLVSAPIPINGGDTLLVTGSAKFGNSLWAIYDAAGGMLRNEAAPATAEGAAVEAVEVEVPVGAATIRVAWDKGVSTIPYAVARADGQGQSGAALPLAGVTVAILGDSIVEHNATDDTNWVDIVAAATGASITNLGVGGTGWMQGQEDGTAYYQRVADIPADTRRVLIYGSGNDRELPLGTPADTGTDTLCGCINATLDAVYAHVPTAWVGVISPAPWQHYPPYERGNAMELMAQAQAAICRRRGVPFLDLYHSSGLRPWDAAFRELAYHDADGVHPNNTGHGLIAPQMLAFLLGGTHNPVDAQEIAEIVAGLVEVPNVKPVAKTEDMTHPVGVDDEGRLWSAPTAGGGGGTARWVKRAEATVTEEETRRIKFDADLDGNPLNIDKTHRWVVESGNVNYSANSYVDLQVNRNWNGGTTNSVACRVTVYSDANHLSYSVQRFPTGALMIQTLCAVPSTQNQRIAGRMVTEDTSYDGENISIISLLCKSGTYFKVGSTFAVWEEVFE